MKLIINPKELIKEFNQLIEEYDNFYWATAWASKNFDIFDELLKNKSKIQKIVVGIHFYQTHPDFIKEFLDDDRVRFTEQPDGTFHPKLYLFTKNSGEWALIIGSANFTKAAFEKNAEAGLLVTHKDNNSNGIHTEALRFIEEKFKKGISYNETDLIDYKSFWERARKYIENEFKQYAELNEKKKPKPISKKDDIIKMNWNEFVNRVRNEDKLKNGKYFEPRLEVIKTAKELFEKSKHFDELDNNERQYIAGVPNKLNKGDWKLFGEAIRVWNTRPSFKQQINEKNSNISKALDKIPLFGEITEKHYNDFKSFFSENAIGTATRFLCMKRPDKFICVNGKNFKGKNKSELRKSFGITGEINLKNYWDFLKRIHDSDWYQNPKPKDEQEQKISEARTAFLDSLFYEGKD